MGAGNFGRVLKAEAVGLKDMEETVKTVAVKTTKSVTNDAALENLVRELKILIYLGSHLNVVNLLGACTKEIHKGITMKRLNVSLFIILLFNRKIVANCRVLSIRGFAILSR